MVFNSTAVNPILIFSRAAYFVLFMLMLFLLDSMPTDTDQQTGWCNILKKEVPIIVLMQNRQQLKQFIDASHDLRESQIGMHESISDVESSGREI